MEENSMVLTQSGLLTFLTEIEQLKNLDFGIEETENGWIISIGDDKYELQSPESSEIEVDQDTVDLIEEIDDEGWNEISDEVIEDVEPVEGGIIKEVLKTLAVGGLVRLTKNALQNA